MSTSQHLVWTLFPMYIWFLECQAPLLNQWGISTSRQGQNLNHEGLTPLSILSGLSFLCTFGTLDVLTILANLSSRHIRFFPFSTPHSPVTVKAVPSSGTPKLPEQIYLYQKPGGYCDLWQWCVLQDQNQLQPSKIVWYLLDRGNHLCRNQYLNGDKLVETCMRDRIQAPKITKVWRESSAPTSDFEPCTVRAKKKMTNA